MVLLILMTFTIFSTVPKVLAQDGSISGRITDEAGNPLTGIMVQATATWLGGEPPGEPGEVGSVFALTDENGHYRIVGLPSGEYWVSTWNDQGYMDEYYNDKLTWLTADTVVVNATEETTGIDFVLSVGGKITGRVTDEAGNPLANIKVITNKPGWQASISTLTDKNGYYALIGLPSGEYYRVYTSNDQGYIDECYNNKLKWETADIVAVTAPNETPDINFALAKGGTISGRVTDEVGNPLKDVGVRAEQIDCENLPYVNWEGTAYTSTDADGYYMLIGLPSGNYIVETSNEQGYLDEYYNDKPNWASWTNADIITVTAPSEITNIDFALAKGGTISGRVTDINGQPLGNICVCAQIDGDRKWGTTDENGNYAIIGLRSGNYRVFTYNNLDFINVFYNDKPNEETADIVAVTAPNETTGIDFALKPVPNFSDVPTDFWAYGEISALASKGAISGYDDGLFRPSDPVFRSQFAKMLVNSLGLPLNTEYNGYFTDVPQDHWAWQYIETAKDHGIVQGYGDRKFGPEDCATRAQLATMLVRGLGISVNTNYKGYFTDVPQDHWAWQYIETAKDQGIVQGYSDGSFRPEQLVRRDQTTVMIYRASLK
ncbi:MAG: carboxypeptidase regulatory-like domain-containing protein [Actinomycetota bacterium]|nr:carboxypeptidase regulatory-like domain-containing protein [Actinomycetota bacterium]